MNFHEIPLRELDLSEAKASKYFLDLSVLPWNRGIIFKRIGSVDEQMLLNYISELLKNSCSSIVTRNSIKYLRADEKINDFIFCLLKHPDIQKKWKYNDDVAFDEMSQRYETKNDFKKLEIYEIGEESISEHLKIVFTQGSVYSPIRRFTDSEIIAFSEEFQKKLSGKTIEKIFKTHSWGINYVGWFRCLFIFRKDDIIIFAVDDYD
ncbi:hypothetical protein CHU92_12535 [Flavobacterium cyanobacteriorum]|uniref:Uncharacterized protein n=1 Tax=Flavobacterium cyanobacteriorum TaxID=2022802 RepID=A0A255YXK5_9FLAO|nr:hypothetical protein [Flavobacterium cyanobacteriorum]OYQ33909.1 hypothetical protein CHU92_12535 [Flavobacterium cyanobacteriorum]